MLIPSLVLKQLYTFGSLKNVEGGVKFSLKNRLSDATLIGIDKIKIDGKETPQQALSLDLGNNHTLTLDQISSKNPLDFPLRKTLDIVARIEALAEGKHHIEIDFETRQFGKLTLKADDAISAAAENLFRIPRQLEDDYAPEIIRQRQRFVEQFTGAKLTHVTKFSFDPHLAKGNCEHFTGVAQVPLGLAGPLKINGEHAQGEFLIPLATSEGTLVASYNRGMKLLNLCGGVKCSVVGDAMQRAPVFVFTDARAAREFVKWVETNMAKIREEAEATSSVARLQYIDPYLASKFVFLRFNFTTGDAAGQNMVGRATFAACSWILDTYNGIQHFYLESNFATDKKASQINIMRTRGKRVTAEAVIKRDALIQHMRVEPESLAYHNGIANVGAILSGANNNGLHSANAITAMFIATGQDVANVAESSAGLIYTELTPERDLYISITIPSLIVATYGGGTGLATQRECLELLGCYGKGKVNKLAEIVTGAVLAGEISLAAAISSSDWVSSHEKYGRNR
ncbi:MAG: hydroxymethylglutaryl-CoA reductase [candidate division KSB1 bacterium]|nr:hydroxymethylglutaryl-CoA reductase [candidate division KSB1 bacterium]MDZ7364793.1 hydroxymethylglutaryl-CoA reductase [candidate division KSB1 bacterium]MDZ7402896.1 hydroxymethylglutaryl-CoA reductase [candidate division KSB1 bacterium]